MMIKEWFVKPRVRPLPLALGLFLGSLPACSLLDGGCDAYAAPMLVVTVRGPGGAPIAGGYTLATYSVSLGDSLVFAVAPSETAEPVTLFESVLPGWSGGHYDVEVRAAGYRTWRRDAIRVREISCGHTIPEQVEATLLLL